LCAETLTIQPDDGKDAFVTNGQYVEYNFGTDQYLIGSWFSFSDPPTERAGLIQFGLDPIPDNATVTSAELWIYQAGNIGTDEELAVFRITEEWQENSVTWAAKPMVDGVIVDTLLILDSCNICWRQWDVTDLVNDWLNGTWDNYGFWIRDVTGIGIGNALFHSSDCSGLNCVKPKLVIEYSLAGVPTAANIDIEPTIIHPHHDGRLGPSGIASLPDDPIPVVVFGASTAAGDPADLNTDNIDPATLAFGPGAGGVSPSHPPVFNLDEDSDGIDDARFTFLMSDAAFDSVTCTDSSGTLTGDLTTGETFEGSDTFTSDCGAVCHN
jgi:hypothetical protein